MLILSHLEELSDGDPVEGVGLLAAKHLEEHVLHIGEVRSLGRPAGPTNGAKTSSATDFRKTTKKMMSVTCDNIV